MNKSKTQYFRCTNSLLSKYSAQSAIPKKYGVAGLLAVGEDFTPYQTTVDLQILLKIVVGNNEPNFVHKVAISNKGAGKKS